MLSRRAFNRLPTFIIISPPFSGRVHYNPVFIKLQPEIGFYEIYRQAKEKAQGSHGVRCPALVLCGLQNRSGRDQLSAHQQHEGVQGVSPWHTTLLARYSVLYLPATGVRKRRRKVGQSALYHGLGKGARGWQVYKVRADHLIRWYALGRNCQSSHSALWASHHAGKSGSFGERVGLIGTYNAVPPTSALKSVNSFIGFEIPK